MDIENVVVWWQEKSKDGCGDLRRRRVLALFWRATSGATPRFTKNNKETALAVCFISHAPSQPAH